MSTVFDAVISPTEIVVCDATREKVAYHEKCGEESVLPGFYEQHKDFFRSLARICRAMVEDEIEVRVTVQDE